MADAKPKQRRDGDVIRVDSLFLDANYVQKTDLEKSMEKMEE